MSGMQQETGQVLERVRVMCQGADTDRIHNAIQRAHEIYGDELHWSGESLVAHALGALDVLLPFQPDDDAIIACLLHHAVGMHGYDLPLIGREFGSPVRSLVGGVHLLSHVTLRNSRSSLEDLRTILLTVSDDVRTVLITLCERSHLLDIVDMLESDDQRRICQDALRLFAPVAARLGIYSLKNSMESHAFPVLYPADAERIREQVLHMELQYGEELLSVSAEMQRILHDQGVHADIIARKKLPYSIFMKMREKGITSLKDIYDFYACRIVVSSVEECYMCLGSLHRLGRPLSQRFKDYIAFPKPNGYQSLHTTLLQPPGASSSFPMEVQIRTAQMHREAEYGIAAHWSYKTYGSTAKAMEHVQFQRMLATQGLLEEEEGESHFGDHIYVLSPRGDIIELPEGATPLDFAFQVHTDLGLAFRGARVNGTMVPMEYKLENGDVVEILKHRRPQPSSQWFQLLKLSASRSKLRRFLYAQKRPALVAQGRAMVNEFLRARALPSLDEALTLLRSCDGNKLSYQQREDILMKIGQGSERVSSLLERVDAFRDFLPQPAARSLARSAVGSPIVQQRSVAVAGDESASMPTRFAKCCRPHETNARALVGVVSRAGIVVVHSAGCGMLRNANPERMVPVRWI